MSQYDQRSPEHSSNWPDRSLSERIQEVRLRMPKATEFDTVLRRKLRDLEDEVGALEASAAITERALSISEATVANQHADKRAQVEALDAAEKALRAYSRLYQGYAASHWADEALAKIEALRSGASGKESS